MFIGIDPDLHTIGFGVWCNGQPAGASVIRIPKRKGVIGQAAVLAAVDEIVDALADIGEVQDFTAIAVEAQTLQRTGSRQHKRPQDIVILGNVAGALLAAMRVAHPTTPLFFPAPEKWKGQIPKATMQARLYKDLGWEYELVGKGKPADYAVPLKPNLFLQDVNRADWKHVGDALLLARWASKQLQGLK